MANNFDSNFTQKIARVFLEKFDTKRSLSKNVNTQLLDGKFNPASGEETYFKRPTDYKSIRTAKGDLTGEDPSPILTGKAKGVVQDYFTVYVDYDEADEAIKMDQLDELLDPMGTRIVTDLEVDFAGFMMRNTNLLAGTVGTPVTSWDHIAEAGAVMESVGIPMDGQWNYAINPFTQTSLASEQRSLGASEKMVSDANAQAVVAKQFAGMRLMTATALASYTTGTGADRAGTLSGTPTATYLAAKDTMQQTLAVTGFQANLVVAAGETITVTGRPRLNLSTRRQIVNAAGQAILFSGTVTETVTLGASGEGSLVISGAGILEADGAYNTVASALTSGDVVTLGGAATTLIQPNLFWHKQGFSIGSVPIKKLHSTDTVATTKDGLQFRVSKGADFIGNSQMVRIDFRPAYACLNPFFSGQGFGRA